MSQIVVRKKDNIDILFDRFDSLYFDTSECRPVRLFNSYYPWYFAELVKLFKDYNNSFSYIIADTTKEPEKILLPKYDPKNIIVCFSGGKDSIATALHYKKMGYNVYLYHLRNINKVYPKEYESAEAVADALGLMLYTEEITLSGNHTYTEHPMKNIIIANSALQFGIRNGIGIKIAFGNYYTALLKDNRFDICGGDCRDMWTIYENIVKQVIPQFRMYIPLKNVKTTLKALEKHKSLLSLCCSCLGPHRYRNYWKKQNEDKYNIKLPPNRCGNCWKCALEYIYYTDHNVWQYNEGFYKHCLEVLLRNSITEGTDIYSIQHLWNNYLFYPIRKSKLKGVQDAIIRAKKIKFT